MSQVYFSLLWEVGIVEIGFNIALFPGRGASHFVDNDVCGHLGFSELLK